MRHELFSYSRSDGATIRVTLLYAASEHGRVDVVGPGSHIIGWRSTAENIPVSFSVMSLGVVTRQKGKQIRELCQ